MLAIGIGESLPHCACIKAILPRESIEIGKLQRIVQDLRDLVVAFRRPAGAAAVLGPLPRDQAGGRAHAELPRHLLTGGLAMCRAPLRPAARPIGPQAVYHQAEAPMPPGTLQRMGPLPFSRLAEFGRPAERQRIAGDRQYPHRPVTLDKRRDRRPGHAALIGLGVSSDRSRERRCRQKETARKPHKGVKSSPISAAGALCVRRPTET